jgi:hypothetical protein
MRPEDVLQALREKERSAQKPVTELRELALVE